MCAKYPTLSVVITPPSYTKAVRLTQKLRKEAREEDKQAGERRKLWNMKHRTPLLVTLHKDEGRIPGGVRLQFDSPEIPRWMVYKRAALPTGNLEAVPDAVLENVEFDDFQLRSSRATSSMTERLAEVCRQPK
jgi:hypothetical protein